MRNTERPGGLAQREARWSSGMRAAQDGDAAAYEQLLEELLPYLRRFVRRRVFDAEAWEDVVQNILLALHRARHTYQPERAFAPWLHAVARNAVVDFVRRRGRREARESPFDEEGYDARAPAHDPTAGELMPELREALSDLPATQRQAVELVHLQGLSVAEAAERAGVSKGALKVRAHRGTRALRARLGVLLG